MNYLLGISVIFVCECVTSLKIVCPQGLNFVSAGGSIMLLLTKREVHKRKYLF